MPKHPIEMLNDSMRTFSDAVEAFRTDTDNFGVRLGHARRNLHVAWRAAESLEMNAHDDDPEWIDMAVSA